MTIDTKALEKEFKSKVCEQTEIKSMGIDRFRVETPFMFDDGDHLSIYLKKDGTRWKFTDEGHTYMHLSYRIPTKNLKKGNRNKLINEILTSFSVEDRNGELVLPISDDQYGDAFFSFTQALLKISDVSFLSRERVKSTFVEDFEGFIDTLIPVEKRKRDWYDHTRDSDGKYKVDYRLEGAEKPIFLFGVNSESKAKDSVISILTYEKWGTDFLPVAFFEKLEDLSPKTVARVTDVCEKTFSSLTGDNKDRAKKYLSEKVPATA